MRFSPLADLGENQIAFDLDGDCSVQQLHGCCLNIHFEHSCRPCYQHLIQASHVS